MKIPVFLPGKQLQMMEVEHRIFFTHEVKAKIRSAFKGIHPSIRLSQVVLPKEPGAASPVRDPGKTLPSRLRDIECLSL